MSNVENTPNAGKLISSLRSTGYNNIVAIADLVDNSIDANASNIRISVTPMVNDFRIIIADDGYGMSQDMLDQAMRLGSDTERDSESDLGKFGMGLITASISLGRKLTVITRSETGSFTSIQDLDEIVETNKFEKILRNSTDEETQLFDRETQRSKTGSIVIIEKCDRLQNTNINQFSKNLVDKIGQVFRMFIKTSNKNIYIRGSKIEAVDPLFLDNQETELYSDETFTINVNGHDENIRLRIVAAPDFGVQLNKIKGLSMTNQGFYLMRNNREIASGEDLSIFTKHNDLNRLRMEVFFSGNIDDEMGINFTKRHVRPTQAITDKIQAVAYPQIKSFRERIKRSQARASDKDIDHSTPAKVISERAKLLVNPKPVFKPQPSVTNNHNEIKPSDAASRVDGLTGKMNCEFQLRELKGGNLFEVDQIGKKVLIYYNIDHPFYQEFIAKNKDNKEIINTIDYLVYSLASAKLVATNQDNQAIFDTFDSIFSSNLRALIG